MTFNKNICEVCEVEYEYDDQAAPSFCAIVCSQGCNETFNKCGHSERQGNYCEHCEFGN